MAKTLLHVAGLLERLENGRQLIGSNADAAVLHLEADRSTAQDGFAVLGKCCWEASRDYFRC